MRRLLLGLIVTILTLTACGAAFAKRDADDSAWRFDVYLDDSKIGWHRYELVEQDGLRELKSEARFDVRFLFIPAFRYRHSAKERWDGDCLVEIEATTSSNGKRLAVEGERTAAGFVVTSGDGARELPACVSTFAYWNPGFLENSRLLNPQSGEFVEVDVEELEPELLEIGGREVQARVYRLTARQIELTLWYSGDDEWLALESVAKGGRVLRYERA